MKHSSIKLLSVTFVLLFVACWTQADLLMYTNRIEFLSVLSDYDTDDFNDLPSLTTLDTPLARSDGGFSYELTTIGETNFAVSGVNYVGTAVSSELDGATLTLGNFSGNVDAIGADFFATDDLANKTNSTGLSVTLNGGVTTVPISSVSTSSEHQFVGFIATGSDSISSVELSSDLGVWGTIDNVEIGVAAAIPEPATLGLISICGIGALFFRRIFE